MDLRQLKTFVMTAKGLSFTKAAHELGYAQSTITGHIQMLEEELGHMLFERLGKQIRLTKDGENFYVYADRMLKLADEAKELISSATEPRGVLTVGTAESLCVHRLAPVFNRYRSHYPKVELGIRFDAGGDYRALLRKNLMDVVILLDVRCDEDDLVSHVLLQEPMDIITAPNHPLAQKGKVVARDFSGQALILTAHDCNYRRLFDSMLTQAGVRPASIMGLASNEAIKKFVCDGWGIGFLPHIAVEKELEAHRLVSLPWEGPPFDIKAQMIYHKAKWISPALKAFIDVTLETFA